KRHAERLLVTGRDLDLLDDWRPFAAYRRKQLDQRGKLGLDFLADELGRGGERAGLCLLKPRLLLLGLCRGKLGFNGFGRGREAGKLGSQFNESAIAVAFGLAMSKLHANFAGLRVKPREPPFELGLLGLKSLTLRARFGQRACGLARGGFGFGKGLCGAGSGFTQLWLLMRARACGGELAAFF